MLKTPKPRSCFKQYLYEVLKQETKEQINQIIFPISGLFLLSGIGIGFFPFNIAFD